jgi:hypothetical protein
MWTVNKILNAEIDIKAGETRIEDGQLAMCLSRLASYGGGSGPLWAVENQCAQFTTESHAGYLQGICRKVDPIGKTITMEITRGPTWGALAMGKTVTLPISSIRRYHLAPQAGETLVFESEAMRSRILAEQAFVEISQREIRKAMATEHSQALGSLIGEPVHSALQEVCAHYLKLCEQINAANGACTLMPSPAISRQRRHLLAALGALAGQLKGTASAPQAGSAGGRVGKTTLNDFLSTLESDY